MSGRVVLPEINGSTLPDEIPHDRKKKKKKKHKRDRDAREMEAGSVARSDVTGYDVTRNGMTGSERREDVNSSFDSHFNENIRGPLSPSSNLLDYSLSQLGLS